LGAKDILHVQYSSSEVVMNHMHIEQRKNPNDNKGWVAKQYT